MVCCLLFFFIDIFYYLYSLYFMLHVSLNLYWHVLLVSRIISVQCLYSMLFLLSCPANPHILHSICLSCPLFYLMTDRHEECWAGMNQLQHCHAMTCDIVLCWKSSGLHQNEKVEGATVGCVCHTSV